MNGRTLGRDQVKIQILCEGPFEPYLAETKTLGDAMSYASGQLAAMAERWPDAVCSMAETIRGYEFKVQRVCGSVTFTVCR